MQNRQEQLRTELLVIECQRGDANAFGELVGIWQKRLWGYAYRVTCCEAAAWDIVQETWCSAIRQLGKLKDVSAFPCWLFRIANNKCVDWVRQQHRQSRLDQNLQANPQRRATQPPQEQADALQRAIARLEPERRALIMLRYSEGFNMRQIASILDIPEGTVKSRLHRTVTELRQSVERDSNE
ncbi:MAG: RNA polymerase sigma factor [Phycisphaerales bacterium]|nr:MAG: RNA polymerase sigma factor [Phycisphaerales bacterium]